jgi:peptide/nickel transport system substrate-binding protein
VNLSRLDARKPRRHLASVLVLVLAVVAACAPVAREASGGPAAADDTLRVATAGGLPVNLDMNSEQGRIRGTLENIYEPLVLPYRDTQEIKGVLAESWTISPDGTTYTFKLRKGVKFHDGTDFDAQSVKDSYDLFRKIGKSDMEPYFENVKELRVVDPSTVEFVIEVTGFPFINRVPGLSILSSKAIKEHGEDAAWWGSNAVGTGPYKLETFTPKDRMVLARNDAWWGTKPHFSKVIFLEVPEASTQALMIEKGDADIAYNIPPDSLAGFSSNTALRVINEKGNRVLNIRMNFRKAPLDNPKVRQALAYAFDYAGIAAARADVAPPDGPVPAAFLDGWTPTNLIKAQDIDKAKALLAEAGIQPGQLEIPVNFVQGDGKQTTTAEIVEASFAKIGVKAILKPVDFNQTFERLQRYIADPQANAADADGLDIFTLVRGPFVPHPYAYFSSYEVGRPYNYYSYENAEANALFDQGYRATSRDQELAAYKQGVEKIVADQPDIWAYQEKRIVVLRSDIEGYYLHPTWFPETHVWEITRKG